MKKIFYNSLFSLVCLISFSCVFAHDDQQQLVAMMIKVKRCLAGVNKADECTQCPSEQSVLAQAVAQGATSTTFLEEVRHVARLSQQPASVMDAITAQALDEKHKEDTLALLQKQENNHFYAKIMVGAAGIAGVAVGYGLRAIMSSSK